MNVVPMARNTRDGFFAVRANLVSAGEMSFFWMAKVNPMPKRYAQTQEKVNLRIRCEGFAGVSRRFCEPSAVQNQHDAGFALLLAFSIIQTHSMDKNPPDPPV